MPPLTRALSTLVLVAAAITGCATSSDTSSPPQATSTPSASSTTPTVATTSPGPSQSGTPTQQPDLAGSWSGTWANHQPDQATGTFRIVWKQKGAVLAGTISIAGTPCLSDGTISGVVHGSSIKFGVVSGQAKVAYTGTVSGDTMSGTYATACGNARGQWSASRD